MEKWTKSMYPANIEGKILIQEQGVGKDILKKKL